MTKSRSTRVDIQRFSVESSGCRINRFAASLYLKNYSVLKGDAISYDVKRSIVAFFLENVALDVATYVTMFVNKTYHRVTPCRFALPIS